MGNSYQWTVTNSHTAPIVRVEIPHYRASLFFAPKGWTFACTNLVAIGSADIPGLCTATAGSPGEGIAPGRSASFGLQLAAGSVKRGFAQASIGFADATNTKINDVLVPVPETLGDKYIPLIGLGVILLSLAAYQLLRARKGPNA